MDDKTYYIIKAVGGENGVVIAGIKSATEMKSYLFNEGVMLRDKIKPGELPLDFRYSSQFPNAQTLYDFVDNIDSILIVSPKVKEVLDGLGVENVEYIPVALRNQNGQLVRQDYFVANVLGGEEIVDLEKSEVEWGAIDDSQLSSIDKLVVNYAGVSPNSKLFRMSKRLLEFVATQEVIDAFEQAGVTGYGKFPADGWDGLYI